MTTRTWLLLNAALLIMAGIAVKTLVETPADIMKQHRKTAQALEPDQDSATQTAKAKAAIASRKAAADSQDTWPKIRRGSLQNIWKMSLFSPERTEETKRNGQDDQETQEEEELPAPPDFELIGILAANNARVAIIELKAAGNARRTQQRVGYYKGRRQRLPQPPQPAKQDTAKAFEPSFVTVHEEQQLGDTGFRVKHINKVDNIVILTKDSFDYKLTMDNGTSHADQRKDSQVTYATSVRERIKAQQAKQESDRKQQENERKQMQAARQQGNQAKAPSQPGGPEKTDAGKPRYVPHTPMRTRANVPIRAQNTGDQQHPTHGQNTWNRSNQRRIRPARQQ